MSAADQTAPLEPLPSLAARCCVAPAAHLLRAAATRLQRLQYLLLERGAP